MGAVDGAELRIIGDLAELEAQLSSLFDWTYSSDAFGAIKPCASSV